LEFADIPRHRPIVGMVATLDPWYNANGFARDFLPPTEISTVVADVRDIEMLVAIGQRRSVAQILKEITDENDERKMWELGLALRDFSTATQRY
jgi:F420-dependent methylenetetrahydromethanopterin dehydrogenase